MIYPNVLVNFRIPVSLKNEFEEACKRLHMPMTAQANLLMREFVNRQKKARQSSSDLESPINFYSGVDDAL
jgi:antitoxin component of RelBE/YafQ-DinJ toxin-antitoxin module